MSVTLEPVNVPAMHRSYGGYWVVQDAATIGLIHWVEHLDGSQSWYGIRRGSAAWAAFGSKEEAVAWATG